MRRKDGSLLGGSLSLLYKELGGNYPKFHKMDGLCKLGFIGAEALLGNGGAFREMSESKGHEIDEAQFKENGAVILFNRSGSLTTDRNYEKTIVADDNYFPSPALFVYTLANIVTGEIAIRHKIYGESSFYILDSEDEDLMTRIVGDVYLTSSPSYVLTGWVEYDDANNYYAKMKLIDR